MNIFKTRAIALMLTIVLSGTMVNAQDEKKEEYQFTPVKVLGITPVQDQGNSGTCWSFSGLGFLEIEALRESGIQTTLSPMYVVAQVYKEKGADYIRYQGHLNFGQGGALTDVPYIVGKYGIVPLSEMTGLNYGSEKHAHNEIDAVTKGYLDGLLSVMLKAQDLSAAWKPAYDAIIDQYFGKAPSTFTFQGKEYTPITFRDALGIDADNYVSITSYTHHPFYQTFVIEVPDNWRHASSYNVPIDELIMIIDNAIKNNYAVAWGGDVSETGFTRDGLAVLIDVEQASTFGSDQERWVGKSSSPRKVNPYQLVRQPGAPEVNVTQEYRQKGFNTLKLTDDHGMVIYGIAKDQTGKEFYMLKNSWGDNAGKFNGTWYMSKAFAKGKTMNIMVHKNAIPKEIRKKLGL